MRSLFVFTWSIASIILIQGQDVSVAPIILAPAPIDVTPLLPIQDPTLVVEEEQKDVPGPSLLAPPPAQDTTQAPSPCPSQDHGFMAALGETFTKLGNLIKLGFGYIKSPFIRQARFQGDMDAALKSVLGIDSPIRNQFATRELLKSDTTPKCEPNGT